MFDDSLMVSLVGTSVIMVVSAAGNITVLTLLVRRKKAGKASRLDALLLHLALADLLVTLLTIPINITWWLTSHWPAGDFMCRAVMFARVFGVYLSSLVVICIALDRYFAVLKPLNVSWEARLRYVLGGAWGGAALASLPEAIMYHTKTYPQLHDDVLCVSVVLSESQQFAYRMFNMSLICALPLLVTVYCSCAVIREIIKRSNPANSALRRSGVGVLDRARARTVKMTVTIVAVFIFCWTPYCSIWIWYYIDENSMYTANPMVIGILSLLAYSNSCANPIVYGIFNIRRKNKARTRTSPQCLLGISEGRRQPTARGSETE